MKRMKQLLITFVLTLSVSLSVPLPTPAIHYNPTISTVQAKAKYVYVTRTGSCYHTHKCGNGYYYKVKRKVAKARGLRKCKKCY